MRAHASVNLFLPSPARWTNSLNSTMVAPGRAAGSASSGSTAVPWHIVASPFPRLGRASSTRACRCFHGFPKFFGEKKENKKEQAVRGGLRGKGARGPGPHTKAPGSSGENAGDSCDYARASAAGICTAACFRCVWSREQRADGL